MHPCSLRDVLRGRRFTFRATEHNPYNCPCCGAHEGRLCIDEYQVLRLEGRTRALEEAAAVAAAAGYEGEAQRGASVIDGLSKARVALALKSAAARRQRDTVKTMTPEVCMIPLVTHECGSFGRSVHPKLSWQAIASREHDLGLQAQE